jgi:hypothetical protein
MFIMADFFGAIAAGEIGSTRAPLVFPEPAPWNGKSFPLSPSHEAPTEIYKKPDTREELDAIIEELRAKYEPFMQRLAPEMPRTREILPLAKFMMREAESEDMRDFSRVLVGEGEWEELTVPHYGGPAGAATHYYRTTFNLPALACDKAAFLLFECVDYTAEVFLNGSYHGVYDLCERIDRKQCGLAKGNDIVPGGMLYKADQWSSATQFASALGSWHGSSTPSERQEEWSGWQIKYPEPSAKKNAKWQPLVDAIQAVSNTSDAEFCQRIGTYFDLPAVRDYYLLIELIFATDNSAKNMYWAIQDYQRDARLTPIPWDMDGTLGRNYAGSDHTSNATKDYRDFLRREGHQNALFERLYKLDPNDWNAQMAKRYRQLRRTHFHPQHLSERITSLLHLMEQSGAHLREAQRWNNANGLRINIPQEAEFIKTWITRRIAYLDTQYNI